jgi:dTDP-4-dehydrorhamnose reductase
MVKTYVFGWNGFIGKEAICHLIAQGHNVIKVGRCKTSDCNFDLLTPNYDFLNEANAGDRFIFLAAISSPDFCSNNREIAHVINVINTKHLISRLLEREISVLFASSDVVYGNTHSVVDEMSPVNPSSVYAEMKLEIEQAFYKTENFYIIRLSYVTSRADKFTSYLINSSYSNTKVEVYDPFIRSLLANKDVVSLLEKFATDPKQFPTLTNLAGPKFLSRLKYVQHFSTLLPLRYTIVTPPNSFFETRPKSILMKSIYLSDLLESKPACVLESLTAHITGNF